MFDVTLFYGTVDTVCVSTVQLGVACLLGLKLLNYSQLLYIKNARGNLAWWSYFLAGVLLRMRQWHWSKLGPFHARLNENHYITPPRSLVTRSKI